MSLSIEYTLREHGWAHLRVACGDDAAETQVSYIEDSLSELAKIALRGFDPEKPRRTECGDFADEPGGLRLTFEPHLTEPIEQHPSSGAQRVTAWVERLIVGSDYPPKSEPLFGFETTAAEWAKVVLYLLEKLYDTFGVVEYQRRWMDGEFPVAEMVRLRHALRLPPVERWLW